MACDRFTKPISGTGVKLTFPTASNSLADLGVSINAAMGAIILDVEGDPQVPSIVGRYWETGQDPTTTDGNPIQSGQQMRFVRSQAEGLKVIALGSAFDGQLTEYESEDV